MVRIAAPDAMLYLLECYDVVVYDRTAQVLYLPGATHEGTRMNPMGDYATMLGQELGWHRHVEVRTTTLELKAALSAAGYVNRTERLEREFAIYRLERPRE
jgi:hypothetical protein